MTTEKYCKMILKQYPKYITKDQMYRICHISKKTCLFLLERRLVPNIDSGKKTHRFKIKTADVIQYLKNREDHPELYIAPEGFYKKMSSFEEVYKKEDLELMRQLYERLLNKYPDVLTVAQVVEFTGYGDTSVANWCGKQKLKCFNVRRRFKIPKEYLLDFLVSEYYIKITVKSFKHRKFNETFYGMQKKRK